MSKKFSRKSGYWSSTNENSFFGKLTNPESQREDWYVVSPYIAEFWCALSNIALFYVGCKFKNIPLILAATVSIISHTIPKQSFLILDKFVAIFAVITIAVQYRSFINDNPTMSIFLFSLLASLNIFDTIVARRYAITWSHVIWHLGAAGIAYIFLSLANKKNSDI
jgi:hypothetical protein